ncbi:GGDEF domain-containing protein [Frigidibacter sp. MR17.24]|uniref:GGDEF domain-containing protein n=1 Tax=Frigidibacter sp. MR17.24 TaxID=3127345 RepID=UPI003012C230
MQTGWPELGRLMPLFLAVSATGEVVATGPTLARILGAPAPGRPFDALFQLCRPPGAAGFAWLVAHRPRRIELLVTAGKGTRLRAQAVPARLPDGAGWLFNLGFGLDVAGAVADHLLTDADFAPTDPTVDMLYLLEAKSAVAAELRGLALRLESAHRDALARALTDPLTGLANRRAFEAALADAMRTARRGEDGFALAHLDLDHFKQLNDSAGHAAGDAVLCDVATILRAEIRARDMAARLGGDEFVLLLRGPLDQAQAEAICTRVIDRITALGRGAVAAEPGAARTGGVSGSFGIALSRDYPAGDLGRMLGDADRALYASKAAGRGIVTRAAPEG